MHVGHEYVGEIVEMGQEVRGFKIGDRVSGEGHITCGFCRNCRAGRRHLCRNTVGVGVNRAGAFAEYLAIPAVNAFKIPATTSPTTWRRSSTPSATPPTPRCRSTWSARTCSSPAPARSASWPGRSRVTSARAMSSSPTSTTTAWSWPRKMGATRAVNVSRENLADVKAELHMVEGFDVGLEMSGVPSAFRASMLEHMNHGGKIALLGIPPSNTAIDWNQVIFKGLEIKGVYGREMFETWYKMVAMLQSGLDLSPILTHRYPVQDFEQGFAAMLSGQSGKVILDWEAAAA
jgi:threonine 3-dehydrogenase